jgi:hypothetical protein
VADGIEDGRGMFCHATFTAFISALVIDWRTSK